MLEEIGITAGEIWHYLEENSEASIGKLSQELKLPTFCPLIRVSHKV